MIMNTNRQNKPGVNWQSFLNINPRNKQFLFDSEGFEELKFFIISDELQVINKVLYGVISIKEKTK